MADKTINDFTAATSLGNSDLFEIETGGNSRKITAANMRSSNCYEAGPVTAPTTADFATWLNQGTSTATDGTGALIIKPQVDGNLHSLVKAVPSAPFDIYCRVETHAFSTAAITTGPFTMGGIALRDSSDGEMVSVMAAWERVASGDEQNLYYVSVIRWTASGATLSTIPITVYTGQPWKWIRVNVTSTTITIYSSTDGRNWFQVGTETIATFIDAVTHYGPCARTGSNSTDSVAVFNYFSTVAPS